MRRGDVGLGYSLLRQTEKAARLHGWMAELSETLSSRAAHHAFVGETQLAIDACEEAVTLAEGTGDLLLVVRMTLPEQLTERQQELLREMGQDASKVRGGAAR